MPKKTFAALGRSLPFLVPPLPLASRSTTRQSTLTIHADQPVSAVSPTLYGLMTEEINYSYDGGLYAEMVRNRTFARGLERTSPLVPGRRRQRPSEDDARQEHRPQRSAQTSLAST